MLSHKLPDSLIAFTAVVLLLLALAFGFGSFLERRNPSYVDQTNDVWPSPIVILWGSIALGIAASGLLARSSKGVRIRAAVLILSLLIAVILSEMLCRAIVPGWPARALHGVSPALWEAAIEPVPTADSNGPHLNSWGERDRERALQPPPGARRIVFVGDSFLEEGAPVPVSLAVESRVARDGFEVINLGVSATGPDEYFERVRGVAGPLGASHVYFCLFAGNDFVSPMRTLSTYWGIFAVEPRASLMTTVGLPGLNHLLTNHRRPVLESWLSGGSLHAQEYQRFQVLRTLTDDDMRSALENASPRGSEERARLQTRLDRDDARAFFEMLRNPDLGRFRSYYLANALDAAATGDGRWSPNDIEIAWHWTRATSQWCKGHQVGLTVVIIPEAFQVDDRMRSQWMPLADMREVTASCRTAAREFVRRASAESLDIVDLHEVFEGTHGTYLNLDGHWSQAGADLAADVLARHLTSRLAERSER